MKLHAIDRISPATRRVYETLPAGLQRQVFEQRGFCTENSLEDLIQEAALRNIIGKKTSLRAWNQRQNGAGWGTGARSEAEQEAIDAACAAAEATASADCIDPLAELILFQEVAARIAADPAAVGREQRDRDLAPGTGRTRDIACRSGISVRRAQQMFDLHREAIKRGQRDLFDGLDGAEVQE